MRRQHGFALVVVVVLLALLVLAVHGLSVLVRVNGGVSAAASHQFRARQHALLGLTQACGQLQQLAGPDRRVTAMAGIAGEPGGSQRRHWCGVWTDGGVFLGWLTSGAAAGAIPRIESVDTMQLVERNSVGVKPASATAYADEEYVDVGKMPVLAPGDGAKAGAYAFWVGDEGVKVSARSQPGAAARIRLPSAPANLARIGVAFQEFDAVNAAKVLSYEQATLLHYAAGSRLNAASLQDGFHHVTLTHASLDPATGTHALGRVNLNTTSAAVWRSLLESYEQASGAMPFGTAAKRTSAVNALANGLAATSSGKAAHAPFCDVASFLNSAFLQAAVSGTHGISAAHFSSVMTPMLVVRSDTFRVRAYGEAVNPVWADRVEATALCEAILQRTSELASNGNGRRFKVIYFRWLAPGDR